MARTFALLVGSREFEDPKLERLSAPWNDVETLGKVLEGNGGFEVDKQADLGLDDIRAAIQGLFQKATRDDAVLLYYAGHGLRDTNGHDLHLALRRTRIDVLRATSLDAGFIRKEMALSRSQRQILIFDCCHSGAFMGGSDTTKKGAQTLSENDVLDPGGTGRYVLAASAANESAFERDGRSIYTEFMVEALRTGAAAPDKAEVTVDDLHDYLVQRVGEDEAPMRPHIWKSAANEPLVLARNPDPRKPVPPELIEGLFDSDPLRAQGAITGLLRLRDGPDKRLAQDAENALRDRLRQRDGLLFDVGDSIRSAFEPTPEPVDDKKVNSGRLPWQIAGLFALVAFGGGFLVQSQLQPSPDADLAKLRGDLAELQNSLAKEKAASAQSEASLNEEIRKLAEERDTALKAQERLKQAQQNSESQAGEVAELAGTVETLREEVADLSDALATEKETTKNLAAERDAALAEAQAASDSQPGAAPVTAFEYAPLMSFSDCDACPNMVVIPGGTFTMGSPENEVGRSDDEGPQRNVTLPGFALAKTEVTFDQWLGCVNGGGCRANPDPGDREWGRGDRPVINVSWNDAQEYIDWLNDQVADADPYRLPTEAEWEFAARAISVSGVPGPLVYSEHGQSIRASTLPYPWGREASREYANYSGTSGSDEWTNTSPVGKFEPNGFGVFDMHGNVWEWVEDCWFDTYDGALADGSARVSQQNGSCSGRVLRGGSWLFNPEYLRSANRDRDVPVNRNIVVGFRPARTLLPLSP